MKKRRTMLFCTLASLGLLTSCVFGQTTTKSSEAQLNDIQKIYKLYQDNGGTLSYEEWLFSIRGPKGDTGEKGADGTSVLTGEGAPASDKGKNGDSYIDLSTWDYYTKEESGWTLKGNLRGPQGEKGETGAQGEKGDTGETGAQGEKGDTGAQGEVGPQGPQGEKGDTGAQGETGPQGPQGEKGETGAQGPQGEKGDTGAQGEVGPQGPQGEKGDTGAQGEKGDKGDTGAQGEVGPQGPQGETGATGKSAYELYKDAHPEYSGTEEQWLDDLVNGRLGTEEPTYYTVTFDLGYGGLSFTQQVEEGQKVKKPETPQRNGYNFVDWIDSNQDHWVFNGFTITDDITLYAVWSDPLEYTIRFVNDDGSLLATDVACYGETAAYNGTTPIAANQDPHYYYTFAGWDKPLLIEGDMTVTATYDATYIATTAYYYDYDGTTLLATVPLGEGEEPHYDGETPTRDPDTVNQLQYQFTGWEKTAETSDSVTFVAKYESCTNGLDFDTNFVTYYHGTSANVVIPSSWNGYEITTINNRAFDGNKTITNVEIPNSVTFIGSYAFKGCSSLKSIVIPEGVRTICTGAFDSCTSLESVTISEGVTSIQWSAFSYCSSLTSINLPASLTQIGGCAFNGCLSLASIDMPSGVAEIETMAFNGCTSLRYIVIPQSVTTIGSGVFDNDQNLFVCCEAEYKPYNWDGQWLGNATAGWGYQETITESGVTYAVFENEGEPFANAIAFDESLNDILVPTQIHNIPVRGVFENAVWSNRRHIESITLPEEIQFLSDPTLNDSFKIIKPTDTSFTGTVGSDGNLWGLFTAPVDGVIDVEETVSTSTDGCIAIYGIAAYSYKTNYATLCDISSAALNDAAKLTSVQVQAGNTYIIKAGAWDDKDKEIGEWGTSEYAGNTETIAFSYTAYTYETYTGPEGDLIKKSLRDAYISTTLDGVEFLATPNEDQSVYTLKTTALNPSEMKTAIITKTYTLGDGSYEITESTEETTFSGDSNLLNNSHGLIQPTDTYFTGTAGTDGNLWGIFIAPDDGYISIEQRQFYGDTDVYIAVYESTATAFTADHAIAARGALWCDCENVLSSVPVVAGHTYVIKCGTFNDRDRTFGSTGSSWAGKEETAFFTYTPFTKRIFTGDEGDLVQYYVGDTYKSTALDGATLTATPNEDQSVYTLKTQTFDSAEMKMTANTKTYTLGEGTYEVATESEEISLVADSWTGANSGTYETLDNGSVIIAFTPTADGTYTFDLTADYFVDVKLGLYDAVFNETGFSGAPIKTADFGSSGTGETLNYYCTAGTTYYIRATYSFEDWNKSITNMTSTRGGNDLTITVTGPTF